MDIQRLRNLTTHRLHTEIGHVYQDIEYLTGQDGIFTHMLPSAASALIPWLEEKVKDRRFFDGDYDISHVGEYDIRPMTDVERSAYLARYGSERLSMPRG